MGARVSHTNYQPILRRACKGACNRHPLQGQGLKVDGRRPPGSRLASVPGVAWANDCRRLGRECRRDSQCCSRNCVRRGDDKVCGCPEGQRRCNDRCVNLKTNERHCGRCFNRCPEGQECVRGVCQGGCPDTQICGDSCCTADESCWSDGEIGKIAICCSNDPYCAGVVTVAGQQVCVNGDAYGDCTLV